MTHRRYTFTLNNPEIEHGGVEALFRGKYLYLVFQLEQAPSGTPHFQGAIRFVNLYFY